MEEWKEYKLGDIYEVHNGLSKGGKFFGSGYPFLSFSTIFNNWFIPNELSNLVQTTDKEQESYSIKEGDVFITRTSETADELGMSCVALKDYPKATYNGFCKRMRQYNHDIEVFPKYIGYYLRNPDFRLHFQAFSGSMSTRASLTNEALLGLTVKLPPLPTQQKIAAILSSLDDKIELNNKINTNLEQQAGALFKNWFVDCMNSTTKMSDIIDVRDGTHDSPKPQESGYLLVTSKHLEAYSINPTDANFITKEDYEKINERSKVDTGDILISMIGTVGIVSLVIDTPVTWAIKNIGLFKTSKVPEIKYYLLNYLKCDDVRNYIEQHLAGSTQKYISLSELRNLPINIPETKVLEKFNKIVSPIYEQIKTCTNENQNLKNLRDTLLPKLMNGEIII